MRVLLVAADAALGATLARGLLHHNVDVTIERSVAEAKERAVGEVFDALIVDGAVPRGIEVCRALRRLGAHVLTIMLIDADSVADRIRARASEADAYMTKPVEMAELLSQLRGAQARSRDAPSDRVVVADLLIDLRSRAVYRAGAALDLTTKESALLEILARRSGTLVDRATLVAHVWGESKPASDNGLEVLVLRLRRKIDAGQQTSLIETHRGRGYRLCADSPGQAPANGSEPVS